LEVYHSDCITQRYQRKIGWIFWACISGKYGRGIGIFWEKRWGTINQYSFSKWIIPQICDYLQAHPGLQFQQDNGPGHTSKYTHEQFQKCEIYPIFWPPYSSDLNPIEAIWNRLKDIMQEQDPEVHKNYKRLQAAIIRAWNTITDAEVKDLIRTTMRERCQAVIDAEGRETAF
jgi:DDE superfamily endonuclease